MSVNCFNIPFKFTIMAAASTAWGRGGCVTGAAGRYPDADKPDHPAMSKPDAGITPHDAHGHP